MFSVKYFAPGILWDRKNAPDLLPSQAQYKATKRGFSFFYISVVYIGTCFCCVCFSLFSSTL